MIKNKFEKTDVDNSDLIALSRNLLSSIVTATDLTNISEMTPTKLAEAKVVLGYLNASNNMIKTKIQCFKLTGLDDKVEAVKKSSRKL